jgi:hypothetical protein
MRRLLAMHAQLAGGSSGPRAAGAPGR